MTIGEYMDTEQVKIDNCETMDDISILSRLYIDRMEYYKGKCRHHHGAYLFLGMMAHVKIKELRRGVAKWI